MKKELFTACLMTYNQAKYIREAIESILMQKTIFSWKLRIADDCSTDGTRDILLEYKKKYPDIIELVLQEKNKGAENNWFDLVSNVESKYVFYTEGDDYITDPNKFQKQVDFLEKNTDFSLCFHPVKVIFEDGSQLESIFPTKEYIFNKEVLTLEDLLKHNFIQTNSAVYRWRFADENILDIFPKNIIPGDYFLHLLHAQKGKIGFIDEVMAVYRRHPGGIWFYTKKNSDELHLKHGIQQLNFLKNIHKTFLNNSEEYFKCKILPFATLLVNLYSARKRPDKLEEFSNLFPEYYNIVKAENNSKSAEQSKKIVEGKNQEVKLIESSELKKPGNFYISVKLLFKKKIKNIPSFLKDIFKNKPDHNISIFIISFNRKEQLKKAINSYKKLNRKVDIIIHDNGSDCDDVLKYLKELEKEGIKVVYGSKIVSSEEINNIKRTIDDYFKNRKASNYIVTDPDIELLNVNDDILDLYEYLLKKYPKATCVGPMLTIRDISTEYPLINHVFDLHIKQFWSKKPQKIIWKNKEIYIQFCPIDTTFAMYRKNFSFKRLNDGIRTYYPYEARHLDWYTHDSEAMKEERERYCLAAKSDVAHWNNKEYIEKFKGKNREKQKIYYIEKNNENRLAIKSEMI